MGTACMGCQGRAEHERAGDCGLVCAEARVRQLEAALEEATMATNGSFGLFDVIRWAEWTDHTEGTEASCGDNAICVAHAILEAVEQIREGR